MPEEIIGEDICIKSDEPLEFQQEESLYNNRNSERPIFYINIPTNLINNLDSLSLLLLITELINNRSNHTRNNSEVIENEITNNLNLNNSILNLIH